MEFALFTWFTFWLFLGIYGYIWLKTAIDISSYFGGIYGHIQPFTAIPCLFVVAVAFLRGVGGWGGMTISKDFLSEMSLCALRFPKI